MSKTISEQLPPPDDDGQFLEELDVAESEFDLLRLSDKFDDELLHAGIDEYQ